MMTNQKDCGETTFYLVKYLYEPIEEYRSHVGLNDRVILKEIRVSWVELLLLHHDFPQTSRVCPLESRKRILAHWH